MTEAEIHFDEGPLAGTRLVGFCLWRSPEGEVYITFPSRAFGAGNERRYFDYLCSTEGTLDVVKRVKAWILDEYRKTAAALESTPWSSAAPFRRRITSRPSPPSASALTSFGMRRPSICCAQASTSTRSALGSAMFRSILPVSMPKRIWR